MGFEALPSEALLFGVMPSGAMAPPGAITRTTASGTISASGIEAARRRYFAM
jgi:hypothetical protein